MILTHEIVISFLILSDHSLHQYINEFNQNDVELYSSYIKNQDAFDFLVKNIPLFDCSDKTLERTYFFRWWSYRKHIKHVKSQFFVMTEFLTNVSWYK